MPRAALREAVMNALVHRDYASGSPVQIRVYNNRVTIANDCRLPEGTTIKDLASAHKSVAINPLVAGAMSRSGQIEAWGRGIERIIKLCVADNLPEPEFIVTPRTFTVCFHIRENKIEEATGSTIDETGSTLDVATGSTLDDATGSTLNDTTGCTIDDKIGCTHDATSSTLDGATGSTLVEIGSTIDEMVDDMKSDVKNNLKILALICENPRVSITEIANVLKFSRGYVIKEITKLKKQGKIRRVGTNMKGFWEVKKIHNPKTKKKKPQINKMSDDFR